MLLSQTADRALTSTLGGDEGYRGLTIANFNVGGGDVRIGVWLPNSQRFDPPDGLGGTVSEALEDAAHKVRI
jgi:hypothetical protein